MKAWLTTLRYGSPFTARGRQLRRAVRDFDAAMRNGQYVEVLRPEAEPVTCNGCGTTYDATDPDVAGRCVHDNLCRSCWAACDRGRSCRDGCHERGER